MKRIILLAPLCLGFSGALSQDIYSQGRGSWCLVQNEIETCGYSSEQICYDVALEEGGYCRQNSRRAGTSGDQEWCVVGANGRRCTYYTQEQCLRDAIREGGGCVYNTELALELSAERKDALGWVVEEQLEESGQGNLANQLQEAAAGARAEQEAAAGAGGP